MLQALADRAPTVAEAEDKTPDKEAWQKIGPVPSLKTGTGPMGRN